MELLLFVLVHMYIKLCESAVTEAFGIGEMQRFVFKQAVTGLRQILQIYKINTFVGKLNLSTLYKLDGYFGFWLTETGYF